MTKDYYFEKMRNTSILVNSYLSEKLKNSVPIDLKDIKDLLFKFVGKRIENNSPLLKPFLLKLCFEISGGKDWKKIIPIMAAMELINISSYQSNYAFDAKNGNGKVQEAKDCYIASMITRELANQCVLELMNSDRVNIITSIFDELLNINSRIYLGQYRDMHKLLLIEYYKGTYKNIDKFYIDYEMRCFELSGKFTMECCRLGAILAGADKSVIESLSKFGKYFGIGLQIVNDIGDLIPSSFTNIIDIHKIYKDQFSDVKNGKLTLPIYFLLNNNPSDNIGLLKRYCCSTDLSSRLYFDLFNKLISSGSFKYSRKICKDFYKKAHLYLDNFIESESRCLLSIMLSSLRSNKYFHTISNYSKNIEVVNEKKFY